MTVVYRSSVTPVSTRMEGREQAHRHAQSGGLLGGWVVHFTCSESGLKVLDRLGTEGWVNARQRRGGGTGRRPSPHQKVRSCCLQTCASVCSGLGKLSAV